MFDDAESIVYDQAAGWSSLVARWAHNPKVGGSNPPPATKIRLKRNKLRGTENRFPFSLSVFSGKMSVFSGFLVRIAVADRGQQVWVQKVNEFYKKGCQEKSSASTGGAICFSRSTTQRDAFRPSLASIASIANRAESFTSRFRDLRFLAMNGIAVALPISFSVAWQ